MTLTELKYLLKLAELKHFGNAAQACHVTQPTLSIAINRLESTLGVSIFERNKNTVLLTEVGRLIVAQAQKTLAEAAQIQEIARASQSQLNHPLKIGAIYTVAPYLFPLLIPALKTTAPEMPLQIHEDYTARLKVKLLNGEIDAALVALPFAGQNLVSQVLYQEPFWLLLRKDHPLSEKHVLHGYEVPCEQLLLLGEGHCFRDQVLKVCSQCWIDRIERDKAISGASLETIRHMVASGLGLTVLPSSAINMQLYDSILCTKPFADDEARRRIALVWRANFSRPKAIQQLLAALQLCKLPGVSFLDSDS